VGAPDATSVVVTNLVYPVTDVMLALVLVGVVLVHHWRPPVDVVMLTLGVVGYVVVDCVFLVQVTAGTFRPGTLLTPLALAANAAIAVAAWLPDRPEPERREALPGVLLPLGFATLCLAVLVASSVRPAPRVAVVLAGSGLAVVIARTALSFRALRRAAQDRRDARTDDLTGLANRRAFTEALVGSLQDRDPRDPLSLVVANLDRFKAVNDTLGHHHGDELLRQVAARLRVGLGTDDVLARIDADEFAMVLPGVDVGHATEVAERLRAAMRRPFPVADRDLEITASLGITGFPRDGDEAAPLLQHADLAMYETKVNRSGHGKDRPQPHQADLARSESVDRLRRAIQDDEIVLHYQSVVSLESGSVQGVEALCRWQHPVDGLIQPAGFLPMMEGGGLMPLFTPNVLGTAIRQAAVWRAQEQALTVAVNLSVTNLLDPAFPDQVAGLLEAGGLPGAALQLELTEDLFLADPTRARQVIADLNAYGVRLVVDDYGTGYSSLGYLRDLHEITGLKLDRSFLPDLVDNPRTSAIVESTLTLARSLGLTVVAEGIETVEVWRRLVELGCELGQGYLFARPVPADRQRFGVVDPVSPPARPA
jgi:diguanylate cyclase (GGDEF)-like protein